MTNDSERIRDAFQGLEDLFAQFAKLPATFMTAVLGRSMEDDLALKMFRQFPQGKPRRGEIGIVPGCAEQGIGYRLSE